MKMRQNFANLLVLLLVAVLLNAVGGALGDVQAVAFLASVLLLIIIGLICSEFLDKVDWSALHTRDRIGQKQSELRHGQRHLLREIHKQLRVLKQTSQQRHQYHDELLKELAVLTRQVNSEG